MPHKISAFRRAQKLDGCATRTGAVNTLVRRGSEWLGSNTDGPAVVNVLARHLPLAGRTAVLLGSGGAARAAAASLTDAGVKVQVSGRTEANAKALADALQVQTLPWGALGDEPFDLLINATPVGSDGVDSPVTDGTVLAGKVVMDMISHPVDTPLTRQALKAGARAVIPGIEMWIQQGLHQLHLWTGETFSAEDIRKELEPHLENPLAAEGA
jgi:shikimate dehydrogenase